MLSLLISTLTIAIATGGGLPAKAPHSVGMSSERLAMIDHVVANVEHMEEWVKYYEDIFGFDLFMHFDINTGRSALMSKVMSSTDGWVKMPINEPSSQNSQIQEYLDAGADVVVLGELTDARMAGIGGHDRRALQVRPRQLCGVPREGDGQPAGRLGGAGEDRGQGSAALGSGIPALQHRRHVVEPRHQDRSTGLQDDDGA